MRFKKIITSAALVLMSVFSANAANAQIIGTGDLLLPSYELEWYSATSVGTSFSNALFHNYDFILDVQMPAMDMILPDDQYVLAGIPYESREISPYTDDDEYIVITYWTVVIYRDQMDPNSSAPLIAIELPFYAVGYDGELELASIGPIPNKIQFVEASGWGLDEKMLRV